MTSWTPHTPTGFGGQPQETAQARNTGAAPHVRPIEDTP